MGHGWHLPCAWRRQLKRLPGARIHTEEGFLDLRQAAADFSTDQRAHILVPFTSAP